MAIDESLESAASGSLASISPGTATQAELTRDRLDAALTDMLRTGKGGECTIELSKLREAPAGRFSRIAAYWMPTLFAWRGRPIPFIPTLVYMTYSSAVIAFGLYYLETLGDLKNVYNYKPEMKDVISILGLAVFLVLSFRNNNAYSRWYEGAGRFYEFCTEICNGACMIASIVPTEQAFELFWWLFAALYSAKQQLRVQDRPEDYILLENIMPSRMWKQIAHRKDKFHWSMYNYHKIVCRINYRSTTEDRGIQECMKLTIPLIATFGVCTKILETPMPFAYVAHLRAFLFLWLLLLPWCFVISYSWWSLLLCFAACYGVLGIEESATECEQPYGTDLNDVPLDEIADRPFRLLAEFMVHVGFDENGNSLEPSEGDKLC